MEKGLMWTPLLIFFSWLTWNGWNEYKKLEAYNVWSNEFDASKYDIYSIIGLKDKQLTWGTPKRTISDNLSNFSLNDVESIQLLINNNITTLDKLPNRGKALIQFVFIDSNKSAITIPFTEISLAAQWTKHLDNLRLQK